MTIEQLPDQFFDNEAAAQQEPSADALLLMTEQDTTYTDGSHAADVVGKELWAAKRLAAHEIRLYRASLDRIDQAQEQAIDPTFRELIVRKLESAENELRLYFGYQPTAHP